MRRLGRNRARGPSEDARSRPCNTREMRPAIAAICQRLLQNRANELSLDLIGEAIGTEMITAGEIEELFNSLERAGRRIGADTSNVRKNLGIVLTEARRLRVARNDVPDVAAIASASKLTPGEVRAALLYASVLGQGK